MKKSQQKEETIVDDVTRAMPHALGCEKSVLSIIIQDPSKHLRIASRENVTEDDFYVPAHSLLFGFLSRLYEDGVEIELVSLTQKLLDNGLLDRIGGPSSLADVYSYATSVAPFRTHLKEVKDKSILRQIIRNSIRNVEAAYGSPSEVKELIEVVEQQVVAVHKKSKSADSEIKLYREQLISPEDIEQETRDYFGGNTLLDGDPFFLPNFALGFRKHEFTVWVGVSNHGKSQAVQNQIAFLASRGRKCMIASLEQKSSVTLAQILKCMTAYPHLYKSVEWEAAFRYATSMIQMYKGNDRTCPKHLVEIMRQAYLNDGVDTFALDNLMCLNVDRGDNSALAAAMDTLRMFFNDYPVHGHLVVHPRKTADENVGKPATQNSIRGPAEIGDMPQSVIVVHRDMMKTSKLAEMAASGYEKSQLQDFWNSTPCGKMIVQKQRATGEMPVCDVWFSKETNQFMREPKKPKPMFSGDPPWYVESKKDQTS